MPIGAAAGTPQYSGNYIPVLYSSLLLVHLYEVTCLAEIANTDWEGEINKKGDEVVIRTLPNVTIRDRSKNQKLVIENPDSPSTSLTIDYEKYFAFIIDRVDEYQSDLDLANKWSAHAAKLMMEEIEIAIFAAIYADAHSSNAGTTAGAKTSGYNLGTTGSPFAVTKANAYDKLVDCNSVLSEQKAPKPERWILLPESISGMIYKSELKDRMVYGDGTSIAMNGLIGKISGFNTYEISTLTSVSDTYTCYHILFGHRHALTFASQFNETDSMAAVEYRGMVMRGFNDYGYKVIKDEVLGDFYCYAAE